MAKIKIGDALCDRCGERIVWKKSDGGSLSYTCQDCDFRGYAPAGSLAARHADDEMGKRETLDAAQPKPATAAAQIEPKKEPVKKPAGLLLE